MSSSWYVYFLRCADNSLYAGITTDLKRRLSEHNTSNKLAAKYTRVRRPVDLVYAEQLTTRSDASSREYQLKRLSKRAKEQLVKNFDLKQLHQP
ncbi:GIY-YIG nuclease family protein [Thalassomonas actiniarum]|uniref:GIY-YIG nuclease family protein n=1 Tax=Thalassomonas actiniarum TaxID=485447 RepID=A0AAE9YSB8_9GAMM|nr:GIY-YIG nuclease family protein [Thalassomonas actiniarum]WDD99553.1 GIY-YIG nuclease family protein [Thalassomonas actiniarum]